MPEVPDRKDMILRFIPAMPVAFPGAVAATAIAPADAIVFAAPHGTRYPGIDDSVHAGSGQALRAALAEDGRWIHHYNFDCDGPLIALPDYRFLDVGDLATESGASQTNRSMIEAATRAIRAAGAVPLMIGGDDSVPIPYLAGFAGSEPLTIVQVDAHIDWRDERRGEPLGYSSTMRRASEMAHVANIVHVGTRGLGSARPAEVERARAWGARFHSARDIHANGMAALADLIPAGAPIVITFDCDALDLSMMPAVMAPTPGGLDYNDVLDLLDVCFARGRVVGFDLIEFVPGRDPAGTAAYLAGNILAQVVARLSRQRR